ncbi:MAG: 16S rRNA (guanine(966)-N(2))-methyltransferase RsmD [Alphaproteobacteria bacterium]|nr:16S rRNA (guanine(966)-N(2))-methyltransferase RsmD [Alphaproteobacteria bacterium]
MRIVAGKHRGARLVAPAGRDVRPTADRARETLFNILAARPELRLTGALVLDVFCGTGALALEALSRGAAQAFLLDSDGAALTAARRNIAKLGEEARATLLRRDARRPGEAPVAADLVFLDPPYGMGLAEAGLAALERHGWIAPGATVVVETASNEEFNPPAGLAVLDSRRVGAARLVILSANPPPKSAA